jgi:hypothetical protein
MVAVQLHSNRMTSSQGRPLRFYNGGRGALADFSPSAANTITSSFFIFTPNNFN